MAAGPSVTDALSARSGAAMAQLRAGTMGDSEQRQIARDSLFVLAGFRLRGEDAVHRVKIRNLSSGGLMAESTLRVLRGTPVSIELRQLGWVHGVVAWVQETRFGVAFDTEIDPKSARAAAPAAMAAPAFVPLRPLAAQAAALPIHLRKV